ncbi:hypothetical protein [Streptosporangium sp. NPDC049078]|uniref:hypothetical protein n=1 Tax=Streptosporangium sp. NPDC049078 TaxID=3155767 RepID=UPI0034359389
MRAAMAAGVLALALGGGVPASVIAPVSAARASAVPRVDDCDHTGPLGPVTGGVCRVVDGVTKKVESGVGDVVHDLEKGVDDLGSRVEDAVSPSSREDSGRSDAGTNAPAPAASASKSPPDRPSTAQEKKEPSGDARTPRPQGTDACRSAAASTGCAETSATTSAGEPDQDTSSKVSPTPTPSASTSPTPSESPSPHEDAAPARKSPVPVPTDRAVPETETFSPDVGRPATDVGGPMVPRPSPVVDAEAPRVELLWPAPVMEKLQRQMPGERPVKPSRSSDTASTVLSTAVLVAAILAVRLLYSRRRFRESIPFEPAPPGRQRVA